MPEKGKKGWLLGIGKEGESKDGQRRRVGRRREGRRGRVVQASTDVGEGKGIVVRNENQQIYFPTRNKEKSNEKR